MKTTLLAAALIHSFKLTVVRLSSSIMPILIVFSGNAKRPSTVEKISQAKDTSSGPCIFGFTI